MRPRVRSYGDNTTLTLSPGTMRTKFIRMRPERVARTSCFSSISTLNMALGRASITLPSTSISSFFAIFVLFTVYLQGLLAYVSLHTPVLVFAFTSTKGQQLHCCCQL